MVLVRLGFWTWDSQTMVPQGCRQASITVDPVALLKREHGMILDQLTMIETAMSPRSGGSGVATGTDRVTLRELLQFFTGPVDVHFRREEVLVEDLQRILGRKVEDQEQFKSFLDEHRMLKADATAVMRKLKRKRADGRDSAASKKLGGLRTLNAELRGLIGRYRGHISCEERVLFVLAEMRLTAEQKRRTSRRMLQV
ncbi:MAG: hemerythrin domain-containing protein [Nitrospira sp.]|nr:hemerythrin domain-containing protein [Nitrospira sp.]